MWDHRIYAASDSLAYWNAQSVFSDTSVVSVPVGSWGFSRMEWVFTRTSPTGVVRPDDVCVCGISFAVTDPATNQCAALGTAPAATVETNASTVWTGLRPLISPSFSLREWRWYNYGAHVTRPGPAWRVTAVGTAGTAVNNRMPDQDAITSTYRTASRKHWGRTYWPGFDQNSLATFGMVATTTCDSIAGLLHTFANAIKTGAGTPEIVVASIKYAGALSMSQLEVDNVWDVQRRRRANSSSYAKIYSS